MTSDMTPTNERIWEIEVLGGAYPSARRSRNRLKVSQRQLSTVLQRIHRMGGKIARIECTGSHRSVPLDAREDINLSSPPSVAPVSEVKDEEECGEEAIANPPQLEERGEETIAEPLQLEVHEEETIADPPQIAEPEVRDAEPDPTPQKPVEPTVQSPVRLYPVFPRRRIDPSQVAPVRRARQLRSRATKRRFWYCDRQLSVAKARRKFFSSQPLRRRRRR